MQTLMYGAMQDIHDVYVPNGRRHIQVQDRMQFVWKVRVSHQGDWGINAYFLFVAVMSAHACYTYEGSMSLAC